MNCYNYYKEQRGYGYEDQIYRGSQIVKGYGLGNMFKKFFKWIAPIAKQHAVPLLETGVRTVGKKATQAINNYLDNVSKNEQTVKNQEPMLLDNSSSNQNEQQSENTTKLKNPNQMAMFSGKGIKRRKKLKNVIILKKRSNYKPDIFDF